MTDYEYIADKFVFKVKKDLFYSRDDVWLKLEPDESMRVGLTDFAQRRNGDILFAEVSPVGTKVERGGILGSYETIKVVQDVLSPIDCLITEVNEALDSSPEVINQDPYGKGWFAILKNESDTKGLLKADEYFELMKTRITEELKKIKGL